MNPPSTDVQDILDAAGIATKSTDLFAGALPDGPKAQDFAIVITDTNPTAPPVAHYEYEYPVVQIMLRGNPGKYREGWQKMDAIVQELNGQTKTINGTRYVLFYVMSGPAFLAMDEKKRPLWTMNLRMQRATA